MAFGRYDFAEIEKKWQDFWSDGKTFHASAESTAPKFYCLTMYPYPSGKLHAGHLLAYTISDVIARQKKMRNFNVMYPMGWDSFGLPAENAAIKNGVPPKKNVEANIEAMRGQMKRAGWVFDWSKELATHHKGYYKWTQWLFLQLYKNDIAYKKNAPVNWCPSCMTVLANEQVLQGQCERCNSDVEQQNFEQWFFKLTAYAQRLLDGHKQLESKWPDRVLKMQSDWIGRSDGAEIDFTIAETGEKLTTFTTRPDTLWGVTFVSISPDHPIIKKLVSGQPGEADILKAVANMRKSGTSEKDRLNVEKLGVFTGCHLVNPVNGDKVPLWIANYALMEYGTGVVMAVPAHDQRDFEFAKKYGMEIKVVINPPGTNLVADEMQEAFVDDGVIVNSAQFDGRNNREAIPDIIAYLKENNKGKGTVNYRIHDWLISRQRYWGCPIPIVYCEKCGEVPVPEKDLPVLLPEALENYKPKGKSPLADCEDFVKTTCPKCGGPARRETDTIDTFIDSSWYYFRYLDPRNENEVFSRELIEEWMPVNIYTGGIEHATMHLLYFRFFTMVMHDLGLCSFTEPATNMFCQGMVVKTAHYCHACKWLKEEEVADGKCSKCGGEVVSELAKVSKTKLNVIDPDEVLGQNGADAMRLMILSDTPPDHDQPWSDSGLESAGRFMKRIWNMLERDFDAIKDCEPFCGPSDGMTDEEKELNFAVHNSIKQVSRDYEENLHFHTAVARIYELANVIRSSKNANPSLRRFAYESFLKLIAPIAPHICEELWVKLGYKDSIFLSGWPEYKESVLVINELLIVVQVNGKTRGRVNIAKGAPEEKLREAVLQDPKVKAHTDGKEIVKFIIVPDKLVNIVVKP